MGTFAKVHEVTKKGTIVIAAEQDYIDTLEDKECWVQTSYNTTGGVHYKPNVYPLVPSEDQSKSLRKNHAGVGYTFDSGRDAFIPPKLYDSWILNEDTCQWNAPVAYPDDDKDYIWNESDGDWEVKPIAG